MGKLLVLELVPRAPSDPFRELQCRLRHVADEFAVKPSLGEV
jgi:hypothetical protein